MSDTKICSKCKVDHNHSTGEVRGLLCARCNTAMGLFGDSLSLMENAINYLKGN